MSEAYAIPPDQPDAATDLALAPQTYIGPQPKNPLQRYIDAANLCDMLEDTDLANLGAKVVEEYDIDVQSRETAGWTERNKAALKLAMQVKEQKNFPWVNASNVQYPLIIEAAIQFNARAYPAIVDGNNVAKGQVQGQPNQDKTDRADRVGRHMSYQLLNEMKGWEEDTDRLLMMLPCVGSVFRKTWWDSVKKRNCSELIGPDKLVANYWAKDDAPRLTQELELYPYQIEERFRSKVWRRITLGQATTADGKNAANDDDAPHIFLEQHRLYDMDGDKYPEPYIVTVLKETGEVVRIVARYDEDGVKFNGRQIECIEPIDYFTKYDFMPSVDGSWLGVGFGQLLATLNGTINTTINQLIDAGTRANTGGGFIGAGATLKGGALRFQPGEWKRIEVPGAVMRDAIVPLPEASPSPVLFQLLGLMIEAAKDISATKDILTGDSSQSNAPVGTTLALIEQGMKVFTAIYKRVHRALKAELKQLFRLNSRYLNDQEYFNFQDAPGSVARVDYNEDDVDVIPVSDPTIVTDMQRLGKAQFMMEMIGKGLDDQAILKYAIESAGIPDAKQFAPKGPPPVDPKVEVEHGKLMLEADKHEMEKKNADVDNLLKSAQTDLVIAQTAQLGDPVWIASIAQHVAQILMAGPTDQGAAAPPSDPQQAQPDPNGPIQPGNVPGMAGPPADGPVPQLPQGPPGGAGPPMGAGPVDGPVDAGAGGVVG